MYRLALVLFILVTVVPLPATAGPWVPERGDGYLKTWIKWLPGMGYSDGDGEAQDYAGYHEVGWSFFIEAGLGYRLAAWVNVPVVQVFVVRDPNTDESTAHAFPGDPTFGLRWGALSKGPFVLAVDTSVKLPAARSGPEQDILGPDAGSAKIGELQVGSGVVDVTFGVSAGLSLPARAYVAVSLGYILRTGGYDHDLYWTAEGGLPFATSFATRFRLTGRHPLPVGDEDVPYHTSPSGIGNGTSYVGFSAEVDYTFPCGWITGLSLEGGLFAVKRQSRGPVISLYVARAF